MDTHEAWELALKGELLETEKQKEKKRKIKEFFSKLGVPTIIKG